MEGDKDMEISKEFNTAPFKREENNSTPIRINFDFYKNYDSVPIDKIAESLGIDRKRNGKYLCVCHDDTNPSMVINKTGKYENKFKCFSCGETGNVFSLVLAARFGIMPSEYFNTDVKERFKKWGEEIKETALYIEDYYPGAITKIEDVYKKNADGFPIVPARLLKEIGLTPNYMGSQRVRAYNSLFSTDKYGNKRYFSEDELNYLQGHDESVTLPAMEREEAAKLLQEKLTEYLSDLMEFRDNLKELFPLLENDNGTRRYINHVIGEKYDVADKYLKMVEKYINEKEKNLELNKDSLEQMKEELDEYFNKDSNDEYEEERD